jgi:serine/threonine protein kinase/Flp pilus assembly protein TadD
MAVQTEESLFHAARVIASPSEQLAYLEEACGEDRELLARVRRLLEFHGFDESLEATSVGLGDTARIATLPEETQIGPYKLLEQIGEGGFGCVYLAEQTQPVKRQVALKILKPGMDSRQIVARFEAERQALALMDHPHIARIIDGGTTAQGRPYFVMELVRGLPITQYCDEHRLTIRQRLELFIQVCQAVQHAHQKGIIHRDIKPSNVLVANHDEPPVPKVIDFGVAKAMNQTLTDKSIYTQFAQLIGTPLYMSPEQAQLSGLDIDTRSDVYSLGVLLYELLTGTTPFELDVVREKGLDELRRMIREDDPAQPSQRISTLNADAGSTISEKRSLDPRKLKRNLSGELDWIVMRALQKDRNRRYQSANELAEESQRYLDDRPVEACPPSVFYRMVKHAKRNRAALVVAMVLVFCMTVISGTVGWMASDRRSRQTHAETIVSEAISAAQPRLRIGDSMDFQLRAAVARAESQLDNELLSAHWRKEIHQLLADVEMLHDLDELQFDGSKTSTLNNYYSAIFQKYGLNLDALPPDDAAAKILASSIAPRLINAVDHWALERWRIARREQGWRTLLKIAILADPDPWRVTLRQSHLNNITREEMEELVAKAPLESQPAATLWHLHQALRDRGANAAALAVLRKAQWHHPTDYWINTELAYMLQANAPKRPNEAIGYARAVIALRPEDAHARANLAAALMEAGQFEEAEKQAREAVRLNAFGDWAWRTLLVALKEQGKSYELAEQIRRMANGASPIAMMQGYALTEDFETVHIIAQEQVRLHPTNLNYQWWLGLAQRNLGSLDEAIATFRKLIELEPRDHYNHNELGLALQEKGRLEEAIASYRQSLDIKPDNLAVLGNLGIALSENGEFEEAIAMCQEAIDSDPHDLLGHYFLGVAYEYANHWKEALEAYEKSVSLDKQAVPRSETSVIDILANCPEVALRDPLQAVERARKLTDAKPEDSDFWYYLGMAQYRCDDWTSAVASLEKSMELKHKGKGGREFLLAMAKWQLQEPAEARQWYDRGLEKVQQSTFSRQGRKEIDRRQAEAAELLQVPVEP